MNVESIKTDLEYAQEQLRRGRLQGQVGVYDCIRRAQDALERIHEELSGSNIAAKLMTVIGQAKIYSSGHAARHDNTWTNEDIQRQETGRCCIIR